MLKKDLIELNRAFSTLAKSGNTKFKYSVLKNMEKIKSSIEIFTDIEKEINEGIKPFEEERVELIKRLGTPDGSGNIAIDLKDEERAKEFQIKYEEALERHKEVLTVYQTKIQEYQDLLNEPLTELFEFRQFSIDELPDTNVNAEELDLLDKFQLIKE